MAPQLLLQAPVEVGGDGWSDAGEAGRHYLPLFAHLLGSTYFPQNFPGKSWPHLVWLGFKAIFRETNKQSKKSIFNFHLDLGFIFYLLILL